jgi:hypothetical protein
VLLHEVVLELDELADARGRVPQPLEGELGGQGVVLGRPGAEALLEVVLVEPRVDHDLAHDLAPGVVQVHPLVVVVRVQALEGLEDGHLLVIRLQERRLEAAQLPHLLLRLALHDGEDGHVAVPDEVGRELVEEVDVHLAVVVVDGKLEGRGVVLEARLARGPGGCLLEHVLERHRGQEPGLAVVVPATTEASAEECDG